MPRRSIPSTTLSAAVRRHFGLQQDELAHLLGITRGLVAHIEAGRRRLTSPVLRALGPLAAHVPDAPPASAPLAALPAPARGPLEARLDYCQRHADMARRAGRPYERQARYAARWQAALPALLAEVPAKRRAWLEARAAPLSAHAVAQWHLVRLRAEALETEAAALEALLAQGGELQKTTSEKSGEEA